jgi:hypothetical protein
MALLKCKECGGSVSSEAKACPSCGVQPSKPMGRLKVLFIGACVIAIGSAVLTPSTPVAAPKVLTTEEIAYNAKLEAQHESRFNLALLWSRAVKSSMRDPDSLQWEAVTVNEDASVACFKYRAKNGFGGFGEEFTVISNSRATKTVADWNRYCTKSMYNLKAAAV